MNNQKLAEGLCKYLDWNDEMIAARKETAPNDAAGVLCEVLYGGENVSKLIGGADALIFRDAAKEIQRLRKALEDVKTYAAGHHAQEESCVWLHGLTIDIPTMIEQVTTSVTGGEAETMKTDQTAASHPVDALVMPVCPVCGKTPERDRSDYKWQVFCDTPVCERNPETGWHDQVAQAEDEWARFCQWYLAGKQDGIAMAAQNVRYYLKYQDVSISNEPYDRGVRAACKNVSELLEEAAAKVL